MKKEIVINYYNSLEFKDIFKFLDDEIKITVYNKSGIFLGDLPNEVVLDNIGREGHTYLNHIITNYENLSDRTIFIQDDFYNHLFSIDYFFNKLDKNKNEEFYQFPCSWRSDGVGSNVISRDVINGYLDLFTTKDNYAIKKFSDTFQITLPNNFRTETCAHFLVSKERILRHKKEKYVKILEWLLTDESNGYTLEHCWKILFM